MQNNPFFSPELRRRLEIQSGNWDLAIEGVDLYKSGVFSLGILFVQLLLFDIPCEFYDLDLITEGIDRVLGEIREKYGEKWVEILQTLLITDENHRFDFVDLKKWFNPYTDDEPIQPTQCGYPESPLKVTITCGLSHVRIDSRRCEVVPCMVSLQPSPHNGNFRMYSSDVVFVIDLRGSMKGTRLDMV